jgi:hypothetical protein
MNKPSIFSFIFLVAVLFPFLRMFDSGSVFCSVIGKQPSVREELFGLENNPQESPLPKKRELFSILPQVYLRNKKKQKLPFKEKTYAHRLSKHNNEPSSSCTLFLTYSNTYLLNRLEQYLYFGGTFSIFIYLYRKISLRERITTNLLVQESERSFVIHIRSTTHGL